MLKLLCYPIPTYQTTAQPSSSTVQTMPLSDGTHIESIHSLQTAEIYKPQQANLWSKASFCTASFESAACTPAEQVILDVPTVTFPCSCFFYKHCLVEVCSFSVPMPHQLLFYVPPVTQILCQHEASAEQGPCLIPSVWAELVIQELSSFVITYLLTAKL